MVFTLSVLLKSWYRLLCLIMEKKSNIFNVLLMIDQLQLIKILIPVMTKNKRSYYACAFAWCSALQPDVITPISTSTAERIRQLDSV